MQTVQCMGVTWFTLWIVTNDSQGGNNQSSSLQYIKYGPRLKQKVTKAQCHSNRRHVSHFDQNASNERHNLAFWSFRAPAALLSNRGEYGMSMEINVLLELPTVPVLLVLHTKLFVVSHDSPWKRNSYDVYKIKKHKRVSYPRIPPSLLELENCF